MTTLRQRYAALPLGSDGSRHLRLNGPYGFVTCVLPETINRVVATIPHEHIYGPEWEEIEGLPTIVRLDLAVMWAAPDAVGQELPLKPPPKPCIFICDAEF